MQTMVNNETPAQRRKRCAQALLDAGYTRHHVDLQDRRTVRMLLVMFVLFGIATTHLAGVTEQAFGMQNRGASEYVMGICGAIVLFCCAAQVAARIQAAGARCGISSVRVGWTSANCCEDLGQAPYFLAGAVPLFLLCVLPWVLGCVIGSFPLVAAAALVMPFLAANFCLSCMVLAAPRGSRFLESDFSEGSVGYDVFFPPAAVAGAR